MRYKVNSIINIIPVIFPFLIIDQSKRIAKKVSMNPRIVSFIGVIVSSAGRTDIFSYHSL